MANGVDGVSGVSTSNPADAGQAAQRDIPADQAVYRTGVTKAEEDGTGAAAGEDVYASVTKFVMSMAIGELQRGLSNSKRMQEESHSALKEAQNEDN